MTDSEILEEFILDKLIENPEFKLESLTRDTTSDDEWMLTQDKNADEELLKQVFEGKLKKQEKKSEAKVKPSGLSPIEAVRQKVSVKTKLTDKTTPLGGEEFEEVFRETN